MCYKICIKLWLKSPWWPQKRGNFSEGFGVLKLFKPFSVEGASPPWTPHRGSAPDPLGPTRPPDPSRIFVIFTPPLTSIPASAPGPLCRCASDVITKSVCALRTSVSRALYGFQCHTAPRCWQVCLGWIQRWNNDILCIKLSVQRYTILTQQRINSTITYRRKNLKN